MNIEESIKELTKKIDGDNYISTRDAKVIVYSSIKQVTDEVEKLRQELTKIANGYTGVCERLWKIRNTKR